MKTTAFAVSIVVALAIRLALVPVFRTGESYWEWLLGHAVYWTACK